MEHSPLQVVEHGPVYEITLNRPDKRNAIDWATMQALDEAFNAVERRSDLRVVVIRGAGESFSAGIDLSSFEQVAARFGEGWREDLFPLTHAYQTVLNKVEACSLPVIALIHGHCIGLGMELALACDFRVVAEGSVLMLPETRLGMIPDVGGTTRLTRLLGPARAKEYIMTGRAFDLIDAERWGLVNTVAAADTLDERAGLLIAELAAAAPLAVSYAKKVIDGASDQTRGMQMEAWAQSILMRSKDFERGMQAALTRGTPEWKGD